MTDKAQFKVVAIDATTKREKFTVRGQFYAGDKLTATNMETGYLPNRRLARILAAARNRAAIRGTKYIVVQVGKTERKLRPVSFNVTLSNSTDGGKTWNTPTVVAQNLRRAAARAKVQEELEWDRINGGDVLFKWDVVAVYAAEVLA